jgi:putative SOS response-associated peptidase YedK
MIPGERRCAMCGRFTLTVTPEQLQQAIPGLSVPSGMAPRYNIAPSQPVAVVPNDGLLKLDYYVWGLIPSWAKDPSIGSRMINARGETLAEKPSFRAAFRRRRCLILADGFYEWQQTPGGKTKTPMYIRLKSGEPFAFAGLWESWNSPDGSQVLSCAIITTTPNALMEPIHNRMPVILPAAAYERWLEPGESNPAQLQALIQPYPAEDMLAYPVSTLVNRPENDVAACIQPA